MSRSRTIAVGLTVVALLGLSSPAQAADRAESSASVSVGTAAPAAKPVPHRQARRAATPARRAAVRQATPRRAAAAKPRSATAKRTVTTKRRAAAPARPRAAAAAGLKWRTHVSNSGLQGAIDQCAGGLTRLSVPVNGNPYYAIHEWCGGLPILSLGIGDRIAIDGVTYQVTAARAEPTGTTIQTAAAGLGGSAYLQTCISHAQFRVVAITAV